MSHASRLLLALAAALALSACASPSPVAPEVGAHCAVQVDDIAWRASAADGLDAAEQADLAAHLRASLADAIGRLPAATDAKPVTVRATITQVETVSPALNATTTLLLFVPLDRGGAAVAFEAVDAESQAPLATLDWQGHAPLTSVRAHSSKTGPARVALDEAGAAFAEHLRASGAACVH